jgi:hypothetical protein
MRQMPLIVLLTAISAFAREPLFPRNVSTFSIVACDPATGQRGNPEDSRDKLEA